MLHDRPLSAESLQSFAAVKQFLEMDGIAYKKSQCFLAIILFTEVFTSLSECGMVKASTYAR